METIVSVGFEKLWDLFSKEHERLSGVSEQITELKADLEMLASFLRDVDAKKQTSELARDCVNKIKEITYDAEDVIETYLLKGERSESNGMKNHIKSLACIPFVRRDTALQTRSISKRISRVIQLMQTSGIKSNNTECGYSQALQDIKREMRHTFSSEYESNLVGLEKKVERLVELVEDGSSHAVSITGLGGLGKTTLARQVFNHYTVKHHFDGLAWVCVSQDFKRKDVWQTILGNLSPGDKDLNLPEDELQKKLVQLLETKKVLIIFDDVWKKQDWDRIKPMFPAERKAGWKVLLTSRNDAIHPHCTTFKPELLTHDECWILLQLIAFPKNDTTTGYIIDEEMVEMAKEMVTHCGRLPLAVKVLGGLLAAQPTLRQWKLISENIKSHIMEGVSSTVDDSSSVNHILSLSFEGLPSYLKQCLLYLASLPKNYPVRMERLAYIWAAEGIKKPRHYKGATIRDVADLYIEELVMRNLVSSERDMETSRFEYCYLHDLMREMCLLKAKEENFLKIVSDPNYSSGGHSHASSKSRRLIICGVTNSFNGEREIKNSKVRYLLFIPSGYRFSIGSNFLKLQPFLRVLDLTGAKFKGGKLPSSIGKLIHLKYLSLADVNQTHLPSSLRNLKSLLYLNLRNEFGRPTNVPNVFKEMLELRYLCLPTSTRCQTKFELGNLLNLESLHNFSTKHSSVTDLHHMTRLRSLSIDINDEEWGLVSSTLCKLGKLEDLRLESSDENANHLKQRKLSDLQHLLSHLTNLTLIGCRLEEDPMPILEKLLQLNFVILGSKSYVGKRMVCSIAGFPKLQTLTLGFLEELEEWIVEEGSMPFLHTLSIFGCDKLKELPDGLRFITSLKELHIFTKETELQKKVSKGGEDYYKIQHIPHIKYIGWQPEPEENEGN